MEKRKLARGSSAGQNYIPGMALKDALSIIAAGIANLNESENLCTLSPYALQVMAHQLTASDALSLSVALDCHAQA
jgi:hypothetical protein